MVEEKLIQQEVIQDEHREISNPCKFDDLPKCWDVNHVLIRRNTVDHFDIYIVVILGAIIDALSERVLQSLISLGLVVINELLHVDSFKSIEVVIVIDVPNILIWKLWESTRLLHNYRSLRDDFAWIHGCYLSIYINNS